MSFHSPSLLGTRPIFPFKLWRKNSITVWGVNKGWNRPTDGKLTFWMSMQPSIFMWRSIVKEGSDLNIEIHKKRSWLQKANLFKRTSQYNVLCKATIKFDDLWKHLVLESQKGSKCGFIFTSIASDMLKIPKQTSQWNSVMQCQYFSSGSTLKHVFDHYQYLDSLLKCNCRPMAVIYGPWMHRSGLQ